MGSLKFSTESAKKRRRQGNDGITGNVSPDIAASILLSTDSSSEASRQHPTNYAGKPPDSYDEKQIPAFILKTYTMIDTCDPTIATWAEDGEMFVVKDPEKFAKEIIPEYFQHNKFSSFGRQLNFYGFRKIHSKPIKNADLDETIAKQVVFHHESFKRGRQDLFHRIRRSTRGTTAQDDPESKRELDGLKMQIQVLEEKVKAMSSEYERKLTEIESVFEGRIQKLESKFQIPKNFQYPNQKIEEEFADPPAFKNGSQFPFHFPAKPKKGVVRETTLEIFAQIAEQELNTSDIDQERYARYSQTPLLESAPYNTHPKPKAEMSVPGRLLPQGWRPNVQTNDKLLATKIIAEQSPAITNSPYAPYNPCNTATSMSKK